LADKAFSVIISHAQNHPLPFAPGAPFMTPRPRTPRSHGAQPVSAQVLSEAHFQAIYDSVNDGIFLLDPDSGRVLDVNRRMCEWFGHTLEAFLALDLGRLGLGLWPFTAEQAVAWVAKARDEGPQTFEWLCATRAGQLLWLELNMRRTDIDGQDRLVVTAGDITQRKRVEMERTARLKRAEAQNAVSLTLAGVGLDYGTALTLIVQHLATQVGDLCTLELLGEDGRLHPAGASQAYVGGESLMPAFRDLAPLSLDAPDGLGAAQVARDGRPIRLEDETGRKVLELVRPEFQAYHQEFRIHSLIIVSIRTSAEVIGTLSLVRGGAGRPYSVEDLAMLQNLADRAALTITNAKLYAENLRQAEALRAANVELERRVEARTLELAQANARLQLLAMEDSLTRLPNRRQFDETLAAEVRRAQRTGDPLALLLCDVDFFKRFNDSHGHAEGDACLRKVGATLRDLFRRAVDLPARYGGEEFAVILPGCGEAQALAAAEKVRRAIEAHGIPHGDSDVGGVVTVSIGLISAAVRAETTPDWFIAQADARLYQSKAGGRNRVTGGA